MKAKTKLTKLWSILLALVMVVGMLPTVALAEGSATATATADFSANPTAALALLNAAKTADAEDSTWDSTTKTLTLNGVNFETTAAIAVILPDDAKIVLNGDNIITSGEATSDSFGICALGDLTINGDGKLDVTGGTATGNSHGIYATNGLSISGGTVKAYGGDTSSGYSYGIYTDGSLTISDDADVTANGGKANYNSYGIYANTGLTISGDNTVVTATGGEERARKSKGIFVNSNYVTIESGKVEATGGKAGVESYGIEARDNIEISGGTVTATGGEVTSGAFTYSFGIYSNNNVTISNTATVTAKGGETTNYDSTCSHGIYASNGLSISGGTVTAQAGTAKTARAFEKSPSISISPNYWWRTSESDEYTQFSDSSSAYTWSVEHTYVEIRDTAPAAATTYTVTFDANGGTGEMEAATGVSGEYTLPANGFTAPEGKQFKAWSVDGKEKAVGDKITVSANTTVKAVWEDIEYTVTVTNGTASPSQAAAGATVTLTANRAPSGQVFDKWVSESGNVTLADATSATTTFTMPAGNVTAKATYKNIPVVTHTVTFEANGGSGSMAAVTGVLGTYTLPANGFTAPDGKQFKAWSVDGKEKAVGDKITVTADTTVKAVWENIPATPIEYEILDGANSSWTQNSDGSLSIRGSGAFSEFVGVKVDGKSVDEKYYTVKEGSTIVTLKAGYLNTLTVGSHTLEMIWTDGSASTTFSVNAKSPQTGDNSMMALWIAVLFVSGFGVVATAVYGKKRKSVK